MSKHYSPQEKRASAKFRFWRALDKSGDKVKSGNKSILNCGHIGCPVLRKIREIGYAQEIETYLDKREVRHTLLAVAELQLPESVALLESSLRNKESYRLAKERALPWGMSEISPDELCHQEAIEMNEGYVE